MLDRSALAQEISRDPFSPFHLIEKEFPFLLPQPKQPSNAPASSAPVLTKDKNGGKTAPPDGGKTATHGGKTAAPTETVVKLEKEAEDGGNAPANRPGATGGGSDGAGHEHGALAATAAAASKSRRSSGPSAPVVPSDSADGALEQQPLHLQQQQQQQQQRESAPSAGTDSSSSRPVGTAPLQSPSEKGGFERTNFDAPVSISVSKVIKQLLIN